MQRRLRDALQVRRVGRNRVGSVTTGVAVAGGIGSLAVAAALAIGHQSAGAATPTTGVAPAGGGAVAPSAPTGDPFGGQDPGSNGGAGIAPGGNGGSQGGSSGS